MLFWRALYSDPSLKEAAIRDVFLAKSIGEFLETKYPGYFFRVTYESKQGVCRITLPELLPPGYGFTIRLSELHSDPGLKCVTRAGGELLERHRLARGPMREDMWREAKQKYRRQSLGILRERNFLTGETRFVLPEELAR